jgi:hypothetical protein
MGASGRFRQNTGVNDPTESRETWRRQAERRSAQADGLATAEDRILSALLAGAASDLAEAARVRDAAALLDHDYLAYWVDQLGIQARWRALG